MPVMQEVLSYERQDLLAADVEREQAWRLLWWSGIAWASGYALYRGSDLPYYYASGEFSYPALFQGSLWPILAPLAVVAGVTISSVLLWKGRRGFGTLTAFAAVLGMLVVTGETAPWFRWASWQITSRPPLEKAHYIVDHAISTLGRCLTPAMIVVAAWYPRRLTLRLLALVGCLAAGILAALQLLGLVLLANRDGIAAVWGYVTGSLHWQLFVGRAAAILLFSSVLPLALWHARRSIVSPWFVRFAAAGVALSAVVAETLQYAFGFYDLPKPAALGLLRFVTWVGGFHIFVLSPLLPLLCWPRSEPSRSTLASAMS